MGIDTQLLLKYKLAYNYDSVEVDEKSRSIKFLIQPAGEFTSVTVPCLDPDYTYTFRVAEEYRLARNLKLDFEEGITSVYFGDIHMFTNVCVNLPKTLTYLGSEKGLYWAPHKLTIDFNYAKADVCLNSMDITLAKITEFKRFENINFLPSDTTILLNQSVIAPSAPHLDLNELGYRPFKLVVPHTVETIKMGIRKSVTADRYPDYLYRNVDDYIMGKYLDFLDYDVNDMSMKGINNFVAKDLHHKMAVTDVCYIYLANPKVTKFIDKVEGAVIVVPKGMSGYVSPLHVSRHRNRIVEV